MRIRRAQSDRASRRLALGRGTAWTSLAAPAALFIALMLGCAACEMGPSANTPGVPGPPQPILFDQVCLDHFRVLWYPHRNTGGKSLTGFGILVRKRTTNWDESLTIWVDGGTYRHFLADLDPRTRYEVKIKSCNGADGRSGCSVWSAAAGTSTVGPHRD